MPTWGSVVTISSPANHATVHRGDPIFVSGTIVTPDAQKFISTILVRGSWMPGSILANVTGQAPNYGFNTNNPMAPGQSLVFAPLLKGEYTIFVEAFSGARSTGTREITITVD